MNCFIAVLYLLMFIFGRLILERDAAMQDLSIYTNGFTDWSTKAWKDFTWVKMTE